MDVYVESIQTDEPNCKNVKKCILNLGKSKESDNTNFNKEHGDKFDLENGVSSFNTENLEFSNLTIDESKSCNQIVCQNVINCEEGDQAAIDVVESVFNSSNVYHSVNIQHGKKIQLGNVTNIYGPVHITHTTTIENTQNVSQQIFLEKDAQTITSRKLNIVDRTNWIAQPPIDPNENKPMQSPAKFVIITHTATEDGSNRARNILLLRNIQMFHIESRGWNDIAYNFLIGCDGNTYIGRGWNVIGAHTFGYNHVSCGIAFIGCFMNKLPTKSALLQAKALINHGVQIGAIDKNYMLVGHCQCIPTESPGKSLFQEIKTWDHWTEISEEHCPNAFNQ